MDDITYGPRVPVAAAMAKPRVAPGIALCIMLVISLLLWAGIIGLVHIFWD
jgi:hypothetical protein